MSMTIFGKSICVLGGGGFLGSHLVEALARRHCARVTAVDRSLSKLTCDAPQVDRLCASIENPDVVAYAVESHDIVVSTTAICNPALYNTEPLAVIDASFTHLLPLVSACTKAGKRLVHFSTCEVYGRGQLDPEGRTLPMREDESALVLGPVHLERWSYAAAKQLLERVIIGCGLHQGLDFTIIRPFNVIGPRMDFLPGVDGEGVPRVLACFIRALFQGEPLLLVDGGQARRSFIYVDELIEAVVRILERGAAVAGQVVNLGNPDNDITIAELARLIIRAFEHRTGRTHSAGTRGVPAQELYGPGYDDVDRRIADISKARRLLDFDPKVSLDSMLPSIVEDYFVRYGKAYGL
ncbi:MAG: NAD-dependent epimerase/dehydratase family protein [Myxococcota bacterium]|jgi:UDP-apiose/xylose synthase|nr:NAD-dependent epimerase/dehydratase family protein [Myxococcota bacterium]